MQLNRLFFALWPTAGVRSACHDAARQLNLRLQSGGRLSSAELYHLTLLFLGDQVSTARQTAALQAADGVRSPPFTLTLDHAGSFRNRSLPWWLASRQPPAELGQLYERLRDALQRGDAPAERMRFTPHLTIVRDATRVLPMTPIAPIEWRVEEFVLIRSRLDLRPIEYEVIGRWPLVAGAQPPVPPRAQMDLGF